MCGSNGNTTAAENDVVPPAAVAAALIMLAAGIVIILTYGLNRKRAWKPEQTFVVNPAADGEQCGEQPAVIEANDLNDQEAGFTTEPRDDGLSNTLKTSLLPPP